MGRLARGGDLSAADLRLLSQALAIVYRHADVAEFPLRALEAARLLVATDHTSYNEIDDGRVIGVVSPADDLHDALVPVFAEFVGQHPRVVHYPKKDDGEARTISDYLSRAELHRTDLYHLVYRPMEVEDQLSIIAPDAKERIVSISCNRSTRSFRARERALLDAFRPHFGLAFANARAVQALKEARTGPGGTPALVRQTAVRLFESGAVRYQGERARDLWARYFRGRRPGQGLPPQVAAWVRRETARAAPDMRRTTSFGNGEGRLTMRLLHDPAAEGWILLLEEHALPAGRGPALSPRAQSVLDLLLQGLSEKEAAARLGIRPSTVHGYVKDIYRHAGVSSRAELLARWIRPPPE